MFTVYWMVFKQSYQYDDGGEMEQITCSGRFEEFGSAFGYFVLACGDQSIARVYVKAYRDDCDCDGDIVCAYSCEWNDIKIGE